MGGLRGPGVIGQGGGDVGENGCGRRKEHENCWRLARAAFFPAEAMTRPGEYYYLTAVLHRARAFPPSVSPGPFLPFTTKSAIILHCSLLPRASLLPLLCPLPHPQPWPPRLRRRPLATSTLQRATATPRHQYRPTHRPRPACFQIPSLQYLGVSPLTEAVPHCLWHPTRHM